MFVNLYYEFNNELLDHVFSEHSNLKCVAYADIHTANEKTNWGGQQSSPPPAPLTYIQQSSGYALTYLANPPTPDGYEFVFGPTDGANNAPGVSNARLSRRGNSLRVASTWALRCYAGTTLARVLSYVARVRRIPWAVLAYTSISGVLLLMTSQRRIPVAW